MKSPSAFLTLGIYMGSVQLETEYGEFEVYNSVTSCDIVNLKEQDLSRLYNLTLSALGIWILTLEKEKVGACFVGKT